MLADIADEYTEHIFSPVYKKISDLLSLNDRRYWVAVAEGRAVGSIGLITIGEGNSVLKSMFLHKAYRGGEPKVAARLLQTAIEWAKERSCSYIYLGTMSQFEAAQRFYEKNGFVRIEETVLPEDYPSNSMDSVFYRKKIN